jgi:hypothetical protein
MDGNWIALGSLAAFIMLQTIIAAFMLGGLFQRVKQLELRPLDGDCKTELAVLNSRFDSLTKDFGALAKDFGEMAGDIKNLLSGQSPAARRRGEAA